jgi:selenocysteine lyase/cysteine desulfurase
LFEDLLPEIRSRFPRLEYDYLGHSRVFLDNGAGSMVLGEAARAEYEARLNYAAEHDAPAEESAEAGKVILKGRRAVADLLNAEEAESIVSGESATSLLFNLA